MSRWLRSAASRRGLPLTRCFFCALHFGAVVDLQVRSWSATASLDAACTRRLRPPLHPPQAQNSYLIFNSVQTGRPIGRGLDSNPSPSQFYALLSASELNGVPGVSTQTTAAISSAMLEDACPLVSSLTATPLATCYSATGGPVRVHSSSSV